MKHTELRAAVLDALENMTPGRRFLMVAPLFLMRRIFRQLPFISPALNTGEELDSDTAGGAAY